MQKIRSQKSLKNFYIRPTTGVGSKGAFSVEKRDNHTNRDMKNINQLLQTNNNNNVLFQVNSYGFKPTQSQGNQNTEQNEQIMPFMTRSEALGNKRQTYPNSDYAVTKNNIQDDFRILVKHKVFSGVTNNASSNNNNNSNQKLIFQSSSNLTHKHSPTQIQLQNQYRIMKHTSQDLHRDQNIFSDENRRDSAYTQRGFQKAQSPRNYNLNGQSSNQIKQNVQIPFEDDLSEVHPNNDQNDNKRQEDFDSDRERDLHEEVDEEGENEQEQLSEIMNKENNNAEDSMNDIQDLATSGFDLTAFRDELKQPKSPLQKFYTTLGQPQTGQMSDKFQSSKGRFPLDSHENSDTNNSDVKRFSSLQKSQKNGSTNQYNFTQSKLSEQRDETIPSLHQQATSHQNLLSANSKENNIQFINLKQDNQDNRISRPITSQNNVSRIKNLQMQTKYNNFKSTSNNFYELFANNFKQSNQNTYTNQLLSTIPMKQQAKIPFFHNYYRNEQIKNLQQTNTFSVKKAQIFSFQIKHNNLMSRQGQRKDSINSNQSNAIASQIQQQLVQGINNNGSISKTKLNAISNSNSKP